MVAEFIRFYGYTAEETLSEYAKRFFALVNSMYRLKARESMDAAVSVGLAMSGDESTLKELKKQSKGAHGILEEVKTVERVKNGK